MTGIYQIKCVPTDKTYIGSAIDMDNRWDIHQRCLRGNYHVNPHLQNAWNKHGRESFEFSVVYETDEHDMIAHEQWCIDVMLPEFNIAKNATAPMLGRKHSDETKAKMSELATGKHPTDETRKKISKSRMGQKPSDETRKKLSKARKGKLIGEKNPASKLTSGQVRYIRYLRDAFNAPYKELAEYFGVSQQAIGKIVTGKRWKKYDS